MKRALSIVLAVMCIICLAACGQDAPAATEPATTPAATVPAATEPVTEPVTEPTVTEPEENTDTVQIDESLLTVTLTIPLSYLGADAESYELDDDFVAEQGYISAEVTEDGNLVIVMTKARQKEILDTLVNGIDEMISNYVGGEETPYIQEITFTEHFTEFTVKVDREGYEKAEYDMTPASLSLSAAFYQLFAGIPANITVNVVDAVTGEVLFSTGT